MYGFGNWGDISDHVGTQTPEACEKHYMETYIDVPTTPLPVFLFNIL
jgi:transcriptional adapter 2-alpha